MDVREKLVEIVKRAAYHCLPSNTQDFHIDMFVTDLLARGVTVLDEIEELRADNNRLRNMWAKAVSDLSKATAHGVTVQECGNWVYEFNLAGSNFYRCSVCDRQETLLEKEDIYEYCPFCHCGAKMMPQPPKGV